MINELIIRTGKRLFPLATLVKPPEITLRTSLSAVLTFVLT